MSGRPRFSVVIPTYNRAALLRRALASVFAQDERDFEVIVVDDGSTDDTASLLAGCSDRVLALRQDNAGPSAARNRGIEAARADYVCTLDSDDVWFPWALSTFDEAIRRSGEPTMVTGTWWAFRDEVELARVERSPLAVERFETYLATAGLGIHVSSGVTAYRREALLASGGFDPRLDNAEDHDLAMRLGDLPGFACIRAPVVVGYRQHPQSIRTHDRLTRALRECIGRHRRGAYPGPRKAQGALLTMHTRPASLACIASNRQALGWQLYLSTLDLNILQRRVAYLLGFPLLSVLGGRAVRGSRCA